ncbi:RhoGEF domain containing protein [Acanthamoeba castellanii str. Neff]|uniref:RhoGEF domain containing protein n=1 Tax=Acanthamoeba castellanii (strain ATCC 30010 / Neff) TaxID=1257118 RepID=L8H2E6_ACACF|nr:RhoGEF domain containing protein [Acanthamoeba castellanii str. Neff]ELR19412.1 RhoGEF domain containing protein [Acanthamoeba castellanii str. Neff]
METSSPRTPQQQRLEGVGSTIVVGRKVGPRAVAGFLAWADFDNPTKWCRRFFVLHDGWLYRFPNANIKARPEVALSVNGGIIDTPDTHPIVAASQMNLFRITTRGVLFPRRDGGRDGDVGQAAHRGLDGRLRARGLAPRQRRIDVISRCAGGRAGLRVDLGAHDPCARADEKIAAVVATATGAVALVTVTVTVTVVVTVAPSVGDGDQLVSPRTGWKKAMSGSTLSLPPNDNSERAEAKLKALQLRATARDVVRLQAIVRGRIARKRYAVIKEMARKRRSVAEEIAQTEKNYVSLLLTTIEVIFEPLQKLNARLDTAQSDQPRLKLLYKMHARFSDALNAAVAPYAHYRQIGAIFNEFRYVVNYETAVKNYHESLACHTYKSFFDVAITHYRCNALDFCSLLIGPVQRITRYVLLLKELSKYTWTEHPDHDQLKLATASIAQIAEEVNEAKRKAEGIQRTLSIQTKLDDRKIGRGLAARRYIREGILSQIVKGQQPRERYVFLFSDQLISSLKKTVRMGLNNTTVRFSSKGAISLLNTVVVRSKKDDAVFKLRSTLPGRSAQTTTKWRANSQRECDSWVQDISLLLAELKHL